MASFAHRRQAPCSALAPLHAPGLTLQRAGDVGEKIKSVAPRGLAFLRGRRGSATATAAGLHKAHAARRWAKRGPCSCWRSTCRRREFDVEDHRLREQHHRPEHRQLSGHRAGQPVQRDFGVTLDVESSPGESLFVVSLSRKTSVSACARSRTHRPRVPCATGAVTRVPPQPTSFAPRASTRSRVGGFFPGCRSWIREAPASSPVFIKVLLPGRGPHHLDRPDFTPLDQSTLAPVGRPAPSRPPLISPPGRAAPRSTTRSSSQVSSSPPCTSSQPPTRPRVHSLHVVTSQSASPGGRPALLRTPLRGVGLPVRGRRLGQTPRSSPSGSRRTNRASVSKHLAPSYRSHMPPHDRRSSSVVSRSRRSLLQAAHPDQQQAASVEERRRLHAVCKVRQSLDETSSTAPRAAVLRRALYADRARPASASTASQLGRGRI